MVEFVTRPGTRLALEISAHGKVWMAFGPDRLLERRLGAVRAAEGRAATTNATVLTREIEKVR